MGIEPGRYIVGNELNSKNPVTGQPEFFLKQVGRRLRKAAADISGYAAPIVGALYGAPAGAATGALLGQYKRENPGDPNQALKMALLGGATGAASSAISGESPFAFKGGSSALRGGISDLFTKGKDFLSGLKIPSFKSEEQKLIEKATNTARTNAINLLKDGDVSNDAAALEFLTSSAGGGKDGKGLGALGSLGTLAGGLFATGILGSQIPKPQDATIDRTLINEPERIDDFAFNPNQTYTRPQAPSAFIPSTLAAEGGVMDLQDGGESNGPGTGTSDSIPAMLSDGEFVMTAKAVRGAGGGDRREGARKMYEAMDKLEAQG